MLARLQLVCREREISEGESETPVILRSTIEDWVPRQARVIEREILKQRFLRAGYRRIAATLGLCTICGVFWYVGTPTSSNT